MVLGTKNKFLNHTCVCVCVFYANFFSFFSFLEFGVNSVTYYMIELNM